MEKCNVTGSLSGVVKGEYAAEPILSSISVKSEPVDGDSPLILTVDEISEPESGYKISHSAAKYIEVCRSKESYAAESNRRMKEELKSESSMCHKSDALDDCVPLVLNVDGVPRSELNRSDDTRKHTLALSSSYANYRKASLITVIPKKEACGHCSVDSKKDTQTLHNEVEEGSQMNLCHSNDDMSPDTKTGQPMTTCDTKQHIQKHTTDESHSCLLCDNTFPDVVTLRKHTQTHKGDRHYSCQNCAKKLTNYSSLKRHMLIHTGEKPHSCSICRMNFTQNDHLKQHLTIHTGEKPYSCDVCRNRFRLKSHLKQHMISHTGEKPFSCSICSKDFSQRGSLNMHMKTHTGEKPYSCGTCQMTFTYGSSLKHHMITHTGEKPHLCSICQRSFGRKSRLNMHMKTHTSDKH